MQLSCMGYLFRLQNTLSGCIEYSFLLFSGLSEFIQFGILESVSHLHFSSTHYNEIRLICVC